MDAFSTEKDAGPSWARPNWPVAELDELNLGLDPTEAVIEKVAAAATARAAAAGADPEAVRRAADDSIRAMMLIRTYRVRGHLAAKLDPLGLYLSDCPADLTPAYHGFTEADLDRPIYICGVLGFEQAGVREIVRVLQETYCGHIGFEYMHINDRSEEHTSELQSHSDLVCRLLLEKKKKKKKMRKMHRANISMTRTLPPDEPS